VHQHTRSRRAPARRRRRSAPRRQGGRNGSSAPSCRRPGAGKGRRSPGVPAPPASARRRPPPRSPIRSAQARRRQPARERGRPTRARASAAVPMVSTRAAYASRATAAMTTVPCPAAPAPEHRAAAWPRRGRSSWRTGAASLPGRCWPPAPHPSGRPSTARGRWWAGTCRRPSLSLVSHALRYRVSTRVSTVFIGTFGPQRGVHVAHQQRLVGGPDPVHDGALQLTEAPHAASRCHHTVDVRAHYCLRIIGGVVIGERSSRPAACD